jgi:hypothetical protein
MPVATTVGEQILQAVVAGPEGANLLYTCTGVANIGISVGTNNQQETQTWSFLVGPTLARPQFYRAIADASVGYWSLSVAAPPAQPSFQMAINSVEADWDAESGRVEVHVEVYLNTGGGVATLYVSQLRYWATILAQVPPS